MGAANEWIDALGLDPHPEGGFYRETYRSPTRLAAEVLEGPYEGSRSISTGIYFLLRSQDRSRFHRLRSDEMWHHYDGSAVTLHLLGAEGYRTRMLGTAWAEGEAPQVLIPAGCWFGATVEDPDSYGLVGCTVAPGFDFRDFDLASRTELVDAFPEHRDIIRRLT